MSKRIFIVSACLFFLTVSCNKQLDLAPENTLVDKTVFTTEAGTEQALSEAYYDFMKAVTNGFTYNYGDFTTPILNKTLYYNTYTNGEATPTDYYVVNTWTAFFRAINNANNVILKIPEYADYSTEKQNQFISEAKFVRAFCYLDLLCLYGDEALSGNLSGLGLPLQLTPFQGYNTGEIIPRNTNAEVFDQIIKDLNEALPNLPDQFLDAVKTRSRATSGAAWALLARAYLYKGDFGNAAAAAAKVLEKSPAIYQLSANLLSVFPPNLTGSAQSLSSEYVFGFPVSQMISNSTSTNNNIGSTYYFKRSYWINKDFINEFEPNDLRVSQLIWKGDSVYNPNMFGEFTTYKFNNPNGRDNVPLIRLPEVMLTRAEALAHTEGINDVSVQLLNQVRNRSLPNATAYSTSDFSSEDALIASILRQRKFELAFEGLYRYDIIRNHIPLIVPDIPENKKVLPIPQSEIDISKGLIQQNSGYR